MKHMYECGCCGAMYHTEGAAHRCEVEHEEWANSDVEITGSDFSCLMDHTPHEIRLTNKDGKTYVHGRVSRENR